MANANNGSGRNITHEIAVGFFVIAIFAGLFIFTVILNGAQLFKRGGMDEFDVMFEKVGGLRRHDLVLVRGMPVGQVENLELEDNGVKVHIKLTKHIVLHEDYRIQPQSSSLLGGMQLVITEGTGNVYRVDGRLNGSSPDNVMEVAGDAFRSFDETCTIINSALYEGGIKTNLEAIIANLKNSSDRFANGEGELGKLLFSDSTIEEINGVVTDLKSVSAKLDQGDGALGRLLFTDDTIVELNGFITDLKAVSEKFDEGNGILGELLFSQLAVSNLNVFVENLAQVSEKFDTGEGILGKLLFSDDTMKDLHDAIADFKIVADRIERGEGLISELLRADGEATLEAKGLIKDGRDMLDDLRETSPISTFSSIFFGAL